MNKTLLTAVLYAAQLLSSLMKYTTYILLYMQLGLVATGRMIALFHTDLHNWMIKLILEQGNE